MQQIYILCVELLFSFFHVLLSQTKGALKTSTQLKSTKSTLSNPPSASYQPLADDDTEALELKSTFNTKHSLPPSDKIPSTQPFPDVSPTSGLTSSHLSKTHSHCVTIQHLCSLFSRMWCLSQVLQLRMCHQPHGAVSWGPVGSLNTGVSPRPHCWSLTDHVYTSTTCRVWLFNAQPGTLQTPRLDDLMMPL